MSKKTLKHLIDMIDDKDIDAVYNYLIRFIPEDEPLPDEIEAIKRANRDITENGTISMDSIDWNEY